MDHSELDHHNELLTLTSLRGFPVSFTRRVFLLSCSDLELSGSLFQVSDEVSTKYFVTEVFVLRGHSD